MKVLDRSGARSFSLKLKMMHLLTKFLGGMRVNTMAWSRAEERHETDSTVEIHIAREAGRA